MDGKFVTNNSRETFDFGSKFAKILKPGDSVLLTGELGAGKTTFVQGLAQGLKIKDRILSPTFVLQRVHKITAGEIRTLNHIDLYRLEGKQQIGGLGLEETFDQSDDLTVIEWADRISDFKPKKGYNLKFIYLGKNKREITIEEIK